MSDYYEDDDDYDYDEGCEPGDYEEEYLDFAEPGGNSSLRAATPTNPRNLPCPTCKEPDQLTPKDVQLGYQCNACADACERGW